MVLFSPVMLKMGIKFVGQNSYFSRKTSMKKLHPLLILLLLMISIVAASCSSGNHFGGSSKKCGCGVNKGMVGY